jgi:hypothetical protein
MGRVSGRCFPAGDSVRPVGFKRGENDLMGGERVAVTIQIKLVRWLSVPLTFGYSTLGLAGIS